MSQTGVKFSPDRIVRITRAASGQITWLEQGSVGLKGSGLAHILENHGSDFANRGISAGEVPDLIMQAIDQNVVVGQDKGGLIYQVIYNNVTQLVEIVTSSNGYIVTAHPVSP